MCVGKEVRVKVCVGGGLGVGVWVGLRVKVCGRGECFGVRVCEGRLRLSTRINVNASVSTSVNITASVCM